MGCVAATVAVLGWAGPVLATATGIGAATLARLVLVALRRRTARRREAELTSAVRLIAAELESGSRPSAAFTAAAGASPTWRTEFTAAATACHAGHDPPFEADELRGLGDAWRVADSAGAPLAAVVRRVADDLAGRVEQRQAVAAAVAGARSSAALLAGLPVLGLLLGAAMQAHPLEVLLTTRAGQLVCLCGVAFDAAGVLWTQRLAASAERG
jgi:tight adherence protein B